MFQNHPVFFTTGRTIMATIARSHAMTFSKVVSGDLTMPAGSSAATAFSSVVPIGKLTSLEQQ